MTVKDVTWRRVYDRLWLRFNREGFGFEDALEVAFGKKEFSNREIKYASKLLNEMEDNAHAIDTRASYDQRVRRYRLLNPEKVSNARAVFQKVEQKALQKDKGYTLTDLIKGAGKSAKWNYMYIKDSAVGFWTNYYRSVDVHHISIREEDMDGWIALFRLWNTQILVNERIVHESTTKSQAIHIHTDLDNRKEQTAEMTNMHYQPPHYAIAECLSDGDILEAVAIMIRRMGTLEWKNVREAARMDGVINSLGFCMDAVNREANRKVFAPELIKEVEKRIEKRTEVIGKTPELGTSVRVGYKDLEKKWDVKCYQESVFTKAVEDLVR